MAKKTTKSPPSIFLITPETSHLNSLSVFLKKKGIQVKSYTQSCAALHALNEENPPQLIITDLILADLDGLQLSHLLRSEEYQAFGQIPVLICTASQTSEEARYIYINLSPDIFLVSSANNNQLLKIIQDLLNDPTPHIPRVLIVEDSASLALLIQKTCESGGYVADIASSVSEAKKAFSKNTFDIAILDYHLPDGSGDILLKKIHKTQPDCICFMITTNPDPSLTLQWMKMGASAYLHKPFAPEYLLEMCTRSLQEKNILATEKMFREKTQQLQTSEERNRAILLALPDIIFRIDRRNNFVDCHTGSPGILLEPPENFIGKPISSVLPPQLSMLTEENISEVLRTGSARTYEYSLDLPDGPHHFETRMVPCGCEEVLAIVREITEQKESQAALEKSTALLQAFLNHIPALVSIVDSEGRYLKINQPIADFFKLAPYEVEGKHFFDLLPPENVSVFMSRLQQIISTNAPLIAEDQLQFEDQIHIFQSILFPIPSENEPNNLFGTIATDVTEQVRMQQQLQLHTDALNAAANAILITDREGIIQWANPAYTKLTGYASEEILGKKPSICKSGYQDEAFYQNLWQQILSGHVWHGEIINQRKDGTTYLEEMTITPVLAENQEITHFIAVKQDISERNRNIVINEARSHLLQYSQDHTTLELLEETLNEAEKISGSLIGFYHFIQENQNSLILQNWSTQTKAVYYPAEAADSHYNTDQASVWDDCFHQRKPVIHNNLASLPHRKGTPKGPAHVERELAVPVIRESNIVAILGVGNKTTEYTQGDIEAVSLFADLAWDLVERKRAEEAREKSQSLLDETQHLAGIGGWEWDAREQQMNWTEETYRIHEIERNTIPPDSLELIEQSMACYSPEDRIRVDRAFKRCVSEGLPYDLECRFTTTGGHKRWIRTMGRAEWHEGQIARVFGNIIDITENKRVQEALESSELRFRNLARNVPGVVFQFTVDPGGSRKISFTTDQITQLLGISLQTGLENVLTDFIDRCHPEDQPGLIESIDTAIRKQEVWQFEGRFFNPSGEILWLQGAANPRQRDNYLIYEGIILDISERKMAELALQQSEHKFRSLVEQAMEMMFLHDIQGNFVDINRAAIETTGYSKEELLSMTVFDIDPDASDRSDQTLIWEELSPDDPPVIFEVNHKRKDGSIYPAEVILSKVILNNQGYMFSLARDITSRKKAEQALRESEQKYRSLTDTTIDWVFQSNRDGVFTYASPNVTAILGYEVHEVLGNPVSEFMEPEKAQRMENYVLKAMSENEPLTAFEFSLLNKDGETVYIETNAVPLLDENGEFTGYFGTCRDITSRKQAQEALRQNEEDLRRAQHVAQVGSWRFDLNNDEVIVSEEARRIYGLGNKDWTISNVQTIPLEQYRPALDSALHELIHENKPYDLQFCIRRPSDDALRHIHSLAEYDSEQNLVIGTIQDVTERVEAEQALRESENLLRTIAANFPNAYLAIIEKNLRVTFSSGQEFRTQNLDPAQFTGLPIEEIFSDNSATVKEHCLKTFQGESAVFELSMYDMHFLFRTVPLTDKNTEITQILIVAEDITDQKVRARNRERLLQRKQRQAEVLTKAASSPHLAQGNIEALAQELTEAAAIAMEVEQVDVWLFSEDETTIRNVDHYEHSSGSHIQREIHAKEDLLAKLSSLKKSKFISIDDTLNDPLTSLNRESYLQPNEITSTLDAVIQRGNRPVGTLSFEHIRNPHQWEEDEIGFACQLADQLALALSNRDRRRVEEDRERLTKAIEQSGEIFMITDASSNIQYVNTAFETTTGYSREEAVGKNPRILQSGKHNKNYYRMIWEDLSRGISWEGRFINKKKDGSLYTESANISPVMDASGEIVNYIAVKRDISEQLLLEQEKERIEEQYRQTQRVEAIGRLAGGVAHDLNNLLTPILLYTEMLLGEFSPDDDHVASLNGIFEAGKRARDLVNQLLAFSRKQNLEYKLVNLNQTIEDFSHLLRRTIREDIQIEAVLGPVDRYVKADIGQIEQVIMNLAVNSQDAMPDGGTLTLETAMIDLDLQYAQNHPGVDPGSFVMLAISDTGIGMDEKTQQRIFEPFFTTKGEAGTGLGLATVYGIVKQHNGNIWVYSEPGGGTSFKIFLPADSEIQSDRKPIKRKLTPLTGTESILIVEDNDQVRLLTHSILEKQGYQVLSAENGSQALGILKKHKRPIHLLLTDVVMPEMNGRELYRSAVKLQPEIKVLYMSGYTDNVIARQGVLEEGIAFIQKPFSVEGLTNTVRTVLEEQKPG
ncbi:MAG: PAS domain S-box protein [Anaerolineales bacterium]|nr:PAS domain S-box protein [Anaerolineales bacterium]